MTPEEKIAALEAELAAVKKNRDSILKEKRELEGRSPVLAEADRMIRLADRALKVDNGLDGYATSRVVIPRRATPAEYQALKAEAEKRGVPYAIEGGDADPALVNNARGAPSTVKYVEDERTFWAHQEMQRQVGIIELNRRAAAAGKTLRIFKSADDLDPEARAKHDRILEAGDPDALLFEGGA